MKSKGGILRTDGYMMMDFREKSGLYTGPTLKLHRLKGQVVGCYVQYCDTNHNYPYATQGLVNNRPFQFGEKLHILNPPR